MKKAAAAASKIGLMKGPVCCQTFLTGGVGLETAAGEAGDFAGDRDDSGGGDLGAGDDAFAESPIVSVAVGASSKAGVVVVRIDDLDGNPLVGLKALLYQVGGK